MLQCTCPESYLSTTAHFFLMRKESVQERSVVHGEFVSSRIFLFLVFAVVFSFLGVLFDFVLFQDVADVAYTGHIIETVEAEASEGFVLSYVIGGVLLVVLAVVLLLVLFGVSLRE